MPLGSRKLGAFKNKYNAGTGTTPTAVSFAIAETFSGNTVVRNDLTTRDGNAVVFNVTSNRPNATLGYIIDDLGSNLTSSDFTDNTLTGNVTTDSGGNATVTKTITSSTGSGHKSFRLRLTRQFSNTSTLATSSTLNIYELTPITASGGDTTETTAVANDPATGNASIPLVFGAARLHTFSSVGTANITITNYGNYEGNANLWNNQYEVTNDFFSYHFGGLKIKSLIIGGGGNIGTTGGGGSGEIGTLHYPFANVSPGTYSVTVGAGSDASNASQAVADPTTMFAGNSSLSKTAQGGGDGDVTYSVSTGFPGSSGGPATFSQSRSNFMNVFGGTDLANRASGSGFDGKEFVYFANANEAGSNPVMGGGGGIGSASGSSTGINHYGFNIQGTDEDGGHGYTFVKTRFGNGKGPSQPAGGLKFYNQRSDFFSFSESPLFNMTNANVSIGGGGGRSSLSSTDGVGATGPGGGTGQNGLATIVYPYRSAYRLITKTNLS